MNVILSSSDGSQEAFEAYYSENYSENSSLSCHDSHRSLASTHSDSEPSNASLQEYMIIVRCLHALPTTVIYTVMYIGYI